MAVLVWDATANRHYETGVDKGVLYPMNNQGAYPAGYAWNGLVGVTESPSGAEATPIYADNIQYLNLQSAEKLGLTIEAFTYPDEFAACDGSAEIVAAPGLYAGQQARTQFGLVYRTLLGNDVDGNSHGYKLHLVYGCLAAPSEKAYASVNESPEAITFSWTVSTTPALMTGQRPVAMLVVDSTQVGADELEALEEALFGTALAAAYLPAPDAVVALLTPTP